jgi:hypothetical protein
MNNHTDEEFRNIISNSFTYNECLKQLGYTSKSGTSYGLLKKKIEDMQIDISHFRSPQPTTRSRENIFIENSTCNQSTLRRWFLKEDIEYKCSICGQEPFWNGKELTLILDHINGYNHDNRLCNLRWVCPNCNYQLETTNGKNINHGDHSKNYCIDCGAPVSNKSTRCISCNNKLHVINENNTISRDELKALIRENSFMTIGKMFSVTDNAIRKWCKKYNLPYKSSDIKKYTDEEWTAI